MTQMALVMGLTRFWPYLGLRVQRLGHVGGIDRGHDDDPDAVAAAALSCSASWRSNLPRMVPQQQPGAKPDHSIGVELELTRDRLHA